MGEKRVTYEVRAGGLVSLTRRQSYFEKEYRCKRKQKRKKTRKWREDVWSAKASLVERAYVAR